MTPVPSLSARLGRALIDRFIDETASQSEQTPAMDLVVQGVADHLEELVSLGIVKPFGSLPNRRVNIVTGWNTMCGTVDNPWMTQKTERRHVADRIVMMLIWRDLHSIAWKVGRGEMDQAAREEATLALEAAIDIGTTDLLWAGEEQDFVSGEDLSFVIVDWNLVVGRRTRDWRTPLKPIEDVEPVRMHQVEIDVPTGTLLIGEWFHADGFTDLVDEGDPWRGGSQAENEADAERYVAKHGFVSVSTSRRNLNVFRKGDAIAIGRHDDEEHPKPRGCRSAGSFMVDLRKVTMADRSVLLDILRGIHPDADVEAMVQKIESDRDVVTLKVKPGRYRISSSGRGYIHDLLPGTSPFAAKGFEPVVLIEKIA